jgi:hypothetical protein
LCLYLRSSLVAALKVDVGGGFLSSIKEHLMGLPRL